ncbi:Cof-type HAD-IIB family hydrolase [Fictibacillus gelatini]|uniref:Cof-type HAD-IIB family hydrolase n=1 Tax=Fictibacillus gelatini TaxID=225985 RepID=UPI00042990D5|nr:Cof-type HAD-IIB family hydrolase [Fictibacillus gelatini]
MEEKIVFFDIDGTLVDEEKRIPDSTKESIKDLQKNGIHVAIATGRSPFMFKEISAELNIDTFVSFNGSYVVFNGEVIYKRPLERKWIGHLLELSTENNHPLIFMDHIKATASVDRNEIVYECMKKLLPYYPERDETYYETSEIFQVLLFCQAQFERAYTEQYNGIFDFVRWHEHSTDVLPMGSSKAKGIEILLKKMNVKRENSYAFGDALNDIEMLRTVGMGIAMGNGLQEAKQAAKYVTKSVSEDGIWHGLKYAGLL